MDLLKKTAAYCKKLKNNEVDHSDIFAFRLVPFMRCHKLILKFIVQIINPNYFSKYFLWWTDETDKKVPKWAKVLYGSLSLWMTTSMILQLTYLGLHRDIVPVPMLLQNVAILISRGVGCFGTMLYPYNRKRTSKLLKTINDINQDILKRSHNALQNRQTSNRMFIALTIISIFLEAMALSTLFMFGWEFTITGLPQFNSFFYQPEPYSVIACLEEVLLLLPCTWLLSVVTSYLCMYIDFILRISFYFRVTAEEMRQLRNGVGVDETNELQKLKSLIGDLNLFNW